MRLDRLDALRALAMLWMAVYHFCFDLNLFGLIQQDFNHDPLWTWQRTAIVSLFLACAGAGQALAVAAGQSWRRFAQRWLQVVICALLVTAGSWWMFPNSYIYFGVLHGIAVMLVIVRLTHGLGALLWPLGALAVLAPLLWAHPMFDAPAWHWLGLATYKPITEDYVPVLPWLGVMWWGCAAGQRLAGQAPPAWVTQRLSQPLSATGQLLAGLGRWPLSFYMLHQPVLLGLLWLAMALSGSLATA